MWRRAGRLERMRIGNKEEGSGRLGARGNAEYRRLCRGRVECAGDVGEVRA